MKTPVDFFAYREARAGRTIGLRQQRPRYCKALVPPKRECHNQNIQFRCFRLGPSHRVPVLLSEAAGLSIQIMAQSNQQILAKGRARFRAWYVRNKEHVRRKNKAWFAARRAGRQPIVREKKAAQFSYPHSALRSVFCWERDLFQVGDETRHWRNHPVVKEYYAQKKIAAKRSRYTRRRGVRRVCIDHGARALHSLRNRLRWYILRTKQPARQFGTYVGCSKAVFRRHIEDQFKRGMSWKNYGKAWHLDHIVPCSAFDMSKESDRRKCFHFSNIQPLWAEENMKVKRDKILPCQPELLLNLNGEAA